MTHAVDSPYVGLDYFVEEDSALFFGRDAERKRIIANLRASRLTLLYAQSGVGKSSLLRAGVAARLLELAHRDAAGDGPVRFVPVVFNTWTRDPVPALIDRLGVALAPFGVNGSAPALPPTDVREAVERAVAATDATPVIILDQFEDFFRYHGDDDTGRRFADALAECVTCTDLRVNFLISIREDSYSRLGDQFKSRIPNVYANYLHLDYLDEPAARAAVVKPVERFNETRNGHGGFDVDERLVDVVLEQVRRDEPADATPRYETAYLQLVMERIWRDPATQQSRELRLETLERLGGAERIVRRHVADAVAGLEPSERRVAAEALRFVVTPGGTKLALTPTDLSGMSNDEHTAEAFRPVLKHLNGERILREVSARADEPAYELFHDKLCDPILDWRRRFEADRRQAALRRHLRRARRIAVGLALVTLSLIALGALAVWQGSEANEQRSEANEHRDAAQSEALVAESYRELPFSPERSMALAVQAWRKADSDGAAAALRRAVGASHLRDTLPLAPLTFARLAPGGVVAGTGPQGLSVWRPLESVRPIHRILPVGRASQSFAVSADGAGVGVYSARGAVIVGTTAPGRAVALRQSRRLVHLAVGPHAALAAGVTEAGFARVWDARSGKVLARWRDKVRETRVVAFDPTQAGTVLLAGCPGRRLRIWSWRSGEVQERAEPASETRNGALGQGCTIEVSPDGRRAVQTLAYGSATLWDLERRRPAPAWRLGGEEDLSDVSWSRDGRRVAVAAGKTALVYDAATGRHLTTMPGHPDWAYGVDLSADGTLVLTTSADGTARVWDVDSRTLIAELSGHQDQVVDGMFLGHGNEVMTVSADGTARRWDVARGRVMRGHGTWILNAAFDASGTRIATSARSGAAMVRNLRTGRRIRVGRGFEAAVGVAFDAPGRRVVVAGKAYGGYGAIEVADAHTGRPLHSFWPNAPVMKAMFSPDGRWVLSLPFPSQGSAELWRLSPSRRYPSHPTRTLADLDGRDVAYSPDGGSLLVTGFDGSVRVTNLRGRTLRRIEGPGDRLAATYDPRGRRVLTLGSNGVARIWDLERKTPPLQLRGAHGPLYGGAFSRDLRRVVTGGVDQVTRVWDAVSGRLLSAQREHGDTINSVSFSPDGTQILSAADDHTARLYPCTTCDPRTEAVVAAAERLLREIRP